MISMAEAKLAANKRLQTLGAEWEETRTLHDAALLSSGTDVPGDELVERIRSDMAEAALLLRDYDLSDVLPGLLIRAFWLGFEYGKAEER